MVTFGCAVVAVAVMSVTTVISGDGTLWWCRQGLEYRDGYLWEGTGLVRRSTVRQVDVVTGAVQQMVQNSGNVFGEGITIVGNDTLLQLTWQDGIIYTYDWPTLRLRSENTLHTVRVC